MTENRRLATIETIAEIHPIPDADMIVRARIRGWDVVVKKGDFKPGDQCIYFEIDSMLDTEDPRFAFLAPHGIRTDAGGRRGHVLRTARLRGQYSQGLALTLHDFPEAKNMLIGTDLTDALNVVKWEPPIAASLAGPVRGFLPAWIEATDEERIQNLAGILGADSDWEATEKIDGTSMTAYVDPIEEIKGVCSHNLDLLPSTTNTLWMLAARYGLHELMSAEWPDQRVAVQGEAYGAGIQANPLKLRGQHFAAFTLYVDSEEIPRNQWPDWLQDISVPVYPEMIFPESVDAALAAVDGIKSLISPERAAEGVVWRSASVPDVVLPDGQRARASFKVISNRYLLKHDR